jgi:hypothetical protein
MTNIGHVCADVKRHRAAALQNLADEEARTGTRQRLGVRQPYAAFIQDCANRPSELFTSEMELEIGGLERILLPELRGESGQS